MALGAFHPVEIQHPILGKVPCCSAGPGLGFSRSQAAAIL